MLLFLSNRYKPKTPENMLDTYLFIDDFFFLNKTLLIMQSFVICEGCFSMLWAESFTIYKAQLGMMSVVLLFLFRNHHANNTSVGCGRVRQSVQPFYSRPALGTCWWLAARAQTCLCREGALLGHRLWPPCLPQYDAQWDPDPLPGGDLWKPGGTRLYILML